MMTQEELPGLLFEFHNSNGHAGRDTIFNRLQQTYAYFPTSLVKDYIARCDTCVKRQPLPKPPVGRPIISRGVMDLIQADCIDMSNNASGS